MHRQPADYYKLPPLRRFVACEEMRPEWTLFFTMAYFTAYLPTEAVVYTPTYVVPDVARIYNTDLYIHDSKIYSYEELIAVIGSANFKGVAYQPSVLMCEVFGDDGCDGHIEQRLDGWRFVASTDFNSEGDNSPLAVGLGIKAPRFMTSASNDENFTSFLFEER